MDKYGLTATGVLGIVIIEGIALLTGHDGTYLALCVGSIGALIGGCIGVIIQTAKTTDKKEDT
jgi:hypothetical protein